MRKYIYIGLGSITFAIGTAAIFIPGLPTTGWYLLTMYFWGKSSEKLQTWLENNKYYKKYITEGIHERKLSQKQRIGIYIVTAAMMAIPFFMHDWLWLRLTLIFASVAQIVSMELYYRNRIFKKGFLKPKSVKPN